MSCKHHATSMVESDNPVWSSSCSPPGLLILPRIVTARSTGESGKKTSHSWVDGSPRQSSKLRNVDGGGGLTTIIRRAESVSQTGNAKLEADFSTVCHLCFRFAALCLHGKETSEAWLSPEGIRPGPSKAGEDPATGPDRRGLKRRTSMQPPDLATHPVQPR